MLHRSTFQLLRLHFSFFLLPVYLFALGVLPQWHTGRAVGVFLILHLLVYPASNGYNSYMDRDETPVGGLRNPLQPTRQLFHLTLVLDALALLLSLLISPWFAVGILFYILASRAYSYRGIRLKRYPVTGFGTVFIFQGAWIFACTYHAVHPDQPLSLPLLPALISSLLIGALYPLTQVYQHEADRRDGVTTLSMLLGVRGSFVFSMLLFLGATGLLYHWFLMQDRLNHFRWYLLLTGPVVLFFLYWTGKAWHQAEAADFTHSLWMNIIATCCITAFFIALILLNH